MSENSNTLLEKLDVLHDRFEEVSTLISDPSVISDQQRYVKLTREYKELERLMEVRKEYSALVSGQAEAKQILLEENDPEMREMAKEQAAECEKKIPGLEEQIKLLLVPQDPEDAKNAILEIRGGTGGDEAALFAGDLFRMYSKFCEQKGWTLTVSSASEGAAGGFKEIVCSVTGADVYGTLKYESGVHRVQRVPATETQGRIHTSAATVAVLPEAEEVDIRIYPDDLRIDVYRASGHGGQYINKTDSAVRITHIPSGISVQCQNERSQHHNKDSAMRILRGRLYDLELSKRDAARQAEYAGKNAISFGSQIRTYTLQPYRLVKDHRNNCEIGDTDAVLDGRIDKLLRDYLLWQHTNRQQQQQ